MASRQADEAVSANDSSDPIIKQIPVVFNQKLAKKLFLLQYPNRPRSRPYGMDLQRDSAQIQPRQGKMELLYRIPTDGENYDPENPTHLENLVLTSSKIRRKHNYAAGVISGGKLHLTPLENLLIMRPTHRHIDEADIKKKELMEKRKRQEMGASKGPIVQREIKHEYVRRGPAANSKAMQRSKHQKLRELVSQEEWRALRIHPKESLEAVEERYKLVSSEEKDSKTSNPNPFVLRKKGYMKHIISVCEKKLSSNVPTLLKSNVPSASSSSRDMKISAGHSIDAMNIDLSVEANVAKKDLTVKVQKLMEHARVVRFHEACDYVCAYTKETKEIVLESLRSFCLLVQGCWVIRSGSARLKNRLSLARNYLLCLFAKDPVVERDAAIKLMQLDFETTSKFFRELAKPIGKGKWKFCKTRDQEFLNAHPDIAKECGEKVNENSLAKWTKLLVSL